MAFARDDQSSQWGNYTVLQYIATLYDTVYSLILKPLIYRNTACSEITMLSTN